jgi:hypothetical protein
MSRAMQFIKLGRLQKLGARIKEKKTFPSVGL